MTQLNWNACCYLERSLASMQLDKCHRLTHSRPDLAFFGNFLTVIVQFILLIVKDSEMKKVCLDSNTNDDIHK